MEQDRKTAALIARNAETLGASRANVNASSVIAALRKTPSAPYDIAFLDPPYPLTDAEVTAALAGLVSGEWLVPGALVVVERSARGPALVWPAGLDGERSKRYGETMLWYGHAARPPAGSTHGQE